jgi:hypothetical protein
VRERPWWPPVDEIRNVFWDSFRSLFPPHAKAVQTGVGTLMISWAMGSDPHARFTHATPIAIRFEDDLLQAMRVAGLEQRRNIARRQEAAVRAGMEGYDPYASLPRARVIVLG